MARLPTGAALLATCSLLALCCVQPSLAQFTIAPPPCGIVGYPAISAFESAPVSCVAFHPQPEAPIQYDKDTATTKYGQVLLQSEKPTLNVVFIDRTGAQYQITASNKPTDVVELKTSWTNLIVKATVGGGKVTAFQPVLYVPFRTVLNQFFNTTFEGNLTNADPVPDGVANSTWVRWTFTDDETVFNAANSTQNFINGTFDNLFKSIKDTAGVCQPALCSKPGPACDYYGAIFGNTTNNVTLSWDPNFNSVNDTDLVATITGTGKLYSTTFVALWKLLNPYTWLPATYTFVLNGTNPNSTKVGVPLNITGVLTDGNRKNQTC